MPSLALSDRLIWFAHCPKAGGTSVEQLMVTVWGDRVGHLHWGWDLKWRGGGWRQADPPNSPQHLIWADAQRSLGRLPDVSFAMVRDPVARLASEYRYQRHHRRGTRAGRVVARLPFAFWVRLMLAVAARHPYAFDNHLRPQADFVPEDARVFRLEDGLDPVADWLGQVTDTALPTPGQALKSNVAVAIAPAIRARIEAGFAVDFTRFSYPRVTTTPPARDMLDVLSSLLAPIVIWLDRRGRL